MEFTVDLGPEEQQVGARSRLTFTKKFRVYPSPSILMQAMAMSVQTLMCWAVMFESQCDPLCFYIFGGKLLGLIQVGAW